MPRQNSGKVTASPIKIDGNKMTTVKRHQNSGEYTCDRLEIYEKVSENELTLTHVIDDQTAVYKFEKCN